MTSSSTSLVLNEQTSVQNPAIGSYGDVLRVGCLPEYRAALRIYTIIDGGSPVYSSGSPDQNLPPRAARLRDCRSNAWFTRHSESGEVRIAASACSLRWCPICSNARRNFVTHEIAEWLTSADHPKLMTLTLRHTELDLSEQINQLYAGFRELRRRTDFKKAVTGGVWFFQVKKSKTDGRWHPHLHALITGRFLPRRRLSHMWCQITSGSEVTDIRAIYEPRSVARDVARYATSPGSLVNLPPDDAIEMVQSLHGRRICGTWGSARTIHMRPPKETEPGKWQALGSWSVVMGMYGTSSNARAIVLSWKTGTPIGEGINCNDIEGAMDRMLNPLITDYNFESVYDHERIPP